MDVKGWWPESLAFVSQPLIVTALLDSLLLIVLCWPSLRPKIGQRQFGWLLAMGITTGHREFWGDPKRKLAAF